MMDWSMFVFCFVLMVNLASSGFGASSDDTYDSEGTLPVSNGTETAQNYTLYIFATSEGTINTATEDEGLAIGIAAHGTRNTVAISDSPIQGATHVSSNGLLHIYLMGSNNQNDISYNGRPLHLAARLLDITSYGEHNQNNVNINGIPTQDGDTGNSTNGRLRIKTSGSINVNKITVNGNPVLPGDAELFRIETIGSNNTNEITFNGANTQPQNSTAHSNGVLKIGILGTSTVNTININDRSIQPGAGLLHLYVPLQSQSDVRVNGGPWEYLNV